LIWILFKIYFSILCRMYYGMAWYSTDQGSSELLERSVVDASHSTSPINYVKCYFRPSWIRRRNRSLEITWFLSSGNSRTNILPTDWLTHFHNHTSCGRFWLHRRHFIVFLESLQESGYLYFYQVLILGYFNWYFNGRPREGVYSSALNMRVFGV